MQSSNLKLKSYDEDILSSEKTVLQEIGLVLKGTREKKSLTLREIKEITCIPEHHILAIEDGAREKLPEDFYLMGFLKRYAKALGLSERSICNMYSRKNRFINTEQEKSEINRDFDLLFDNGGDKGNLFRIERKKLNNMDKEKSFFSIFHFYLLIGAVLFISAIYLVFNLIVNNPFDSRNKTFKEVIVENEEEADMAFEADDESEVVENNDIEDKINTSLPSDDVVLEFKKVKNSTEPEDEEYEEVAVVNDLPKKIVVEKTIPDSKEVAESKIIIKSILPKNNQKVEVSKPVIAKASEKVIKPVQPQTEVVIAKKLEAPKPVVKTPVKVVKQVQKVADKPVVVAQKPISKQPVKVAVVQKPAVVKPAVSQPVKVAAKVVSKPVVQPTKQVAKTAQSKTQAKPIVAKTVPVKPQQLKPTTTTQTQKVANNQKPQKFCDVKQSPVKKSVEQKPVVIAKANIPAKSEPSNLRAAQSPVAKVQESAASEEIMLRPLRIVE